MSVRCLLSGIWLERRHSGLSEAEGLKLEEHLALCHSCREQAETLDGLRQLITSTPHALAPRTRQRIIRNALARAASRSDVAPAQHWGVRSLGFGAAALAAAGAAAAVAVWSPQESTTPPRPRNAPVAGAETKPHDPAQARGPAPAVVAAPSSAPAEVDRTEETGKRGDSPATSGRERTRSASGARSAQVAQGSAASHLRRARAALAKRAVPEAERSIASALRARPTREQRAEAESLEAECALVTGRRADAQALYTTVAEKYRNLDAGDNALFAASRLAQQRDAPETRRLLQRYLERYPRGRFRSDAERRLATLEQP